MKHLPIGGSSFDRTVGCSGWLDATKNLPKQVVGPAAIAGSMHHEVQEAAQRDGKKPEDLIGLVYKENNNTLTFTEDDLDLSNIAFNATNKLMDALEIEWMEIEPFVQLIPDVAGGSIDMLGLSKDEKILLILDYKFGQGKVEIKENNQLQFYGVAAEADPRTADMFSKIDKIVYAIIQPKLKGTVFIWESTPKELAVFKKRAMKAIEQAQSDNPERHSGPHCKYCAAAAYCRTKKADVVAAKKLGARLKTDLQSGADILEEVEDWLNAMKSELYVQLTRGVSIKGWKIVDKRASLKWLDAGDARTALNSAKISPTIFEETKMRTAPQVRDALKKNKIEFDLGDFTESKSSGTTLAPEHHDGEAVTPGVPDNLKKLMGKKK